MNMHLAMALGDSIGTRWVRLALYGRLRRGGQCPPESNVAFQRVDVHRTSKHFLYMKLLECAASINWPLKHELRRSTLTERALSSMKSLSHTTTTVLRRFMEGGPRYRARVAGSRTAANDIYTAESVQCRTQTLNLPGRDN